MNLPSSDERAAIELALTEPTQQALHESTGHLYDALAKATLETDESVPKEVFEELEELYVATAEESVSHVRITYESDKAASERDRTVEH